MRRRWNMPGVLLILSLVITAGQEAIGASTDEKRSFLKLLAKLPHGPECYTDEGFTKAAPYTRILFSLTDDYLRRFVDERDKTDAKDLRNTDLHYLLIALSRGLMEREGPREYGVKHFGQIAHPAIRLAWAVMLFNEKAASLEDRHVPAVRP
jgi:hypothetical protein